MRRFIFILVLTSVFMCCITPQHALCQLYLDWETMWIKFGNPNPSYPWMANTFTGLAYDSSRERLYVISVKTVGGVTSPEVWILNTLTGDTLGKLIIDQGLINSGASNGLYCLFKIRVAEDGSIYACNMVSPPGGAQGSFKVFKWASPTSNPRLVLSASPGNKRWGDAFAVIGRRDSTQIFVSGGSLNTLFNNECVVYKATDTSANNFTYARAMTSSLNGLFSHGLAPTGTLTSKPVWANASIRVTSLQTQAGTPITVNEVPVNIDRISSGTVRYFEMPYVGRKFLATSDGINEAGGDSTRARIIDITDPNSFFLAYSPTTPIGLRPLQGTGGVNNYAQDVDVKVEGTRPWLFVLMSNNGIACYRIIEIPVELENFNAATTDHGTELQWSTATEKNNLGFEVQRSIDGKIYSRIAFVSGHGTTNEPHEYFYRDDVTDMPRNVERVNYRLKQTDLDGTFQYSHVVSVLLHAADRGFALSQNYPNPFNPSTAIYFSLTHPSHVKIILLDPLGRELEKITDAEYSSGTHKVEFDGSQSPSGMYFYRMIADDFIATKKMILLR